jgi:hypothetical protein
VRALLIGAAATAVLAFAAPAWAQDPPQPPPDDSAVSQYVEEVPSAWGEAAPGVPQKKSKQRSNPLSSAIQTRVRATGGTDAAALERNATTPSLGAPVRRKRPTPAPRQTIRPHDDAPTPAGAFSAAVTAVGDGGGLRFAVLGIGLLAITAATGFGAVRRSRGTV